METSGTLFLGLFIGSIIFGTGVPTLISLWIADSDEKQRAQRKANKREKKRRKKMTLGNQH